MNTARTVIITGGTKGIGKGASLAFAKKGYNVVISARSEAPELLKQIKELGGEATFIKADVNKEQDIINLIDETVKKYGKLDVFVNNAAVGGTRGIQLADLTTENFEEVIQGNVLATFWGMKYAIQAMLKTGGGNIVNVSSGAGLKGVPGASHYSAAKHAVMGLTKSTAIEYATKGIRINAIAPGAIRTERLEERVAQGAFTEEKLKSLSPMGKIGDVQDTANAILFLSSDEVPFMTGAILTVDGGLSAQ